ncbi:metallophosphoesterase [Aquibacillus sp. 3ASR75-11]|uniref:Metallophosphoesterase n=1 Tax=Terrihalobacillus insolitus TaxID=2950438 RepID=A0A9X3WUY1_9BACI|nr:metallophosphoesterase [Terrihalobacillus insolitus]MDC3412754.1 metallophosphoesterase [Terrihalobacillus insolitus]MDC3423769.1 metallophosphoesterase [Terrihalobacillus insolitus]
MKRRSFLKKSLTSTLSLFGLSGGTYYYAKEIEPSMLRIQKEQISSSKIPKTFHNYKIVQFSDTHIGFNYNLDQFSELIEEMNKQKADIVIFTGDLVDKPQEYDWNQEIIDLLQRIDAPKKYWIYGNHDHGGYGTEIVKETMDRGGFVLLQNSSVRIEKSSQYINLAGIDDIMLGKPDIKKTLNNVDPNYFTIFLVHEPDFADTTKSYDVDIQLSGHSHGGQIQIPFFGYVYTPALAEKYVEGRYNLPASSLTLYVSRGIGTTRLPYRFLCKPEFTVYQLKATVE